MSKVSIELDLSVVQDAIHSKVRPAVDNILAKYDIAKMIEDELTKPSEDEGHYMVPFMWRDTARRPSIEDMISAAIRDEAQKFIKRAIKSDRDRIEAGFKKMLRDSPDALAKTMLASLEGALKEDWRFTIETTVTPEEPDRYDD